MCRPISVPGCHHGTIHRLVAEAIDEYGVQKRTIGVASVGCSVFLYSYFDIDVVESPHGRASAVATGVKRARPDCFVFTYQGDGDLAAIGTAEIIHAANRGEDITVIFVNNTIYGMTGGQMAPTTLVGQKTSTSPYGRNQEKDGAPLRMAELLAQLEGVAFSARVAVNYPEEPDGRQTADQKGLPLSGGRKGVFFHRGALRLSDQLGNEPVDRQ